MNIDTVLQMGYHHTHYCEDHLFTENLGKGWILSAVMDGCTMGRQSHFASALFGKILKKASIEAAYRILYDEAAFDAAQLLEYFVRNVFMALRQLKQQLLMDTEELLTTLVLLVADTHTQRGMVQVLGDGWVSLNGRPTVFDHHDRPDYLAYHLGKDFDDWYKKQQQKITFDRTTDLVIATDGILSFTPLKHAGPATAIDPLSILLHEREDLRTLSLRQRLILLEREYGLMPLDDLAIVRWRQGI